MNYQLTPSFVRMLKILMCIVIAQFTGLIGCASIEQQYAGYKVIDKQMVHVTKQVPVRITSCVTPRGQIVCERRYGSFDECSLRCKTPENTWIERPAGYGGYEDRPSTEYYLVLQAPSGNVEKRETSEQQFRNATIGQTFGALGSAPNPLPSVQANPAPAVPAGTQEPKAVVPTIAGSQQSSSVPGTSPSSVRSLSVADAQRRLNALGFDAGPVDGVVGAKTVRAVRAFQATRKITVTGMLDENTVSELLK